MVSLLRSQGTRIWVCTFHLVGHRGQAPKVPGRVPGLQRGCRLLEAGVQRPLQLRCKPARAPFRIWDAYFLFAFFPGDCWWGWSGPIRHSPAILQEPLS